MSVSPPAGSDMVASASPGTGSGDRAGPSQSKATAREDADVKSTDDDDEDGKEDEGDEDLFGGDDDDEDEDDDDEEEGIARPRKQIRRVQSGSPEDGTKRNVRGSLAPSSAESTRSASPEDRYAALEHRETSVGSPMGVRDVDGQEEEGVEEQVAEMPLPSLPVRRGVPHFYARLPNLLQYRAEVFDEESFDHELEDEQLQDREGIRIDDKGLRSLLTSSNTIRWRRKDKVGADGTRLRESNARIVRWSDGSSSLQLGSEFYDISIAAERLQGAPSLSSSKSSIVPPQPVQHLTHLFVKHEGQDQVNVFQAETPIVGSMMFRPTSLTSESHQRLAKAVRKQKGTLVKETVVKEDPEAEKERIEKEQKKAQQKRQREARKRQKALNGEDDDDDAFWANARTTRRSMAGQSARASEMYDEDDLVDDAAIPAGEQDDDGFVVDDDLDGDVNTKGATGDDMDIDEFDEMDRMEARMERQEARRKAGDSERRGADDGTAAPESMGQDTTAAHRRRRIVEESDEE